MCFFIPDQLLEQVGDKRSLKISQRLRNRRNRIVKSVAKLFKRAVAPSTPLLNRFTYDCENKTKLPGTLVINDVGNSNHLSSDEIVNQAHNWVKVVYNFYLKNFGRNSIDDAGMPLLSSVHYDKDYNNAFWNSEQMVYGDGDGKIFIPLTADLSVVAHELQHGVTEKVCGLYYFSQPGALNESISDCFGIACEHQYKGESDPAKANWLLGDEIIGTEFPGKAIRSFKNEKAYSSDPQPKHMNKYSWTFQDNQGVHINSGIPNHAFYLMCLYMNEPSYGKPIQILYHALPNLKAYSTFNAFVKAMVASAKELYGEKVALYVKKAYSDVGL